MNVFTYGTLMFPEVWRAVVGREFDSLEGLVARFAILRVKDAVFPGITESGGDDCVSGVVFLDVDETTLARLDRFEDDFYERRTLIVACEDGQQRPAEAYVVPAYNQDVLTTEVWDRDTFVATGGLEHFIRGFQGFARIAD